MPRSRVYVSVLSEETIADILVIGAAIAFFIPLTCNVLSAVYQTVVAQFGVGSLLAAAWLIRRKHFYGVLALWVIVLVNIFSRQILEISSFLTQ